MELEKLLKAKNRREEEARWDMAYWVSNMVSVHTKRPVTVNALMQPFSREKTVGQKQMESEQFFEDFKMQREEVTKHGNNR